jgi:hypothetical protein
LLKDFFSNGKRNAMKRRLEIEGIRYDSQGNTKFVYVAIERTPLKNLKWLI